MSCFQIKKIGEEEWQDVPEKIVLEKLVNCFDPVTPILTQMLEGSEIVLQQETYRVRY
jgi:hypothetical protein